VTVNASAWSLPPPGRTHDEPQRVGVGVVEELAHRLGIHVHGGHCLEREELVAHAHAPRPFEQHIELGLIGMAVSGGGLSGRQAPHPRADRGGAELLGEIGVGHTHLV
jgi:hypothetical protein